MILLRLIELAENNGGEELGDHKRTYKKLSDRIAELGDEHITVEIVEATQTERVQLIP